MMMMVVVVVAFCLEEKYDIFLTGFFFLVLDLLGVGHLIFFFFLGQESALEVFQPMSCSNGFGSDQ